MTMGLSLPQTLRATLNKIKECNAAVSGNYLDIGGGHGELISEVIAEFKPNEASIENTFVNKNALSSLKLGHARGAIMVAVANQNVICSEYAPNLIKKTIVGQGHADKSQVALMVSVLLSIKNLGSGDASDALAIAITHAHHRTSNLSKVLQNDR